MDEHAPVWADAISATHLGNPANAQKSGIFGQRCRAFLACRWPSAGSFDPHWLFLRWKGTRPGGGMIKITNMHPTRGRIAATFTATVGELVLPGCALIRRGDGYGLSLPRIGAPGETRAAPLSAVMEAELLRVAAERYAGSTAPPLSDIKLVKTIKNGVKVGEVGSRTVSDDPVC